MTDSTTNDRKISSLPELTQVEGGEQVWAVVNGNDYRVKLSTIAAGLDESVVTAADLLLKADKTTVQTLQTQVDAIHVPDVSALVTSTQLITALTSKADQTALATLQQTVSAIQIPDVTGLATTVSVTQGLALKADETEVQALAQTVADIHVPDVSGFATITAVQNGLSGKADQTALNTLVDVVAAIHVPDVSNLVTSTQLSTAIADIHVPDISGLATSVSVTEGLALKADQTALDTLAQTVGQLQAGEGVDLSGYTTTVVTNALTARVVTLEGVQPPDLSGLATTQSVTDALALKSDKSVVDALAETVAGISAPDLSGLATKTEVTDGLALKADASALEPLTAGLALKADQTALQALQQAVADIHVPDVSGLATTQSVTDGLALKADETALQTLAQTVAGITEPDISGLATKTEVTDGLVLKADKSAFDTLVTEVAGIHVPDISGLATAQSVSDGLALKANQTEVDTLSQTVAGIHVPDISGLATAQSVTDGLALKVDTTALATALGLKTDLTVTEALQAQVNGIHIPDLTNYVALPSAPNPGEQPVFRGGAWESHDSIVGRVLWVGASPGATVQTGSPMNPFVNIQDAIDTIPVNSPGYVVLVAPRSAGGNHSGFTIPDNKINIMIQGWGCIDAHPVRIDGQVLLTGANNTRHKLKDMAIWSTTTTQVPLVFDGSQGRHYLDNVTVERFAGSTVDAVSIQGSSRNWIDCHNCNFDGNVRLGGTPVAGAALFMRGTGSAGSDFIMEAAYTLLITDTINIKHIQHNAGNLALNSVINFGGNSGVAIDSTADTGLFTIRNSDMQTPAGVFMKINKTGAAPYIFHNVNRDTLHDVVNGTRITMSGTTVDLRADYPALHYSGPLDGSVHDHLSGIDTEIGALINSINTVAAAVADIPSPSVILPTFEGSATGASATITASLAVLKGNGYDVMNLDLNVEYRVAGSSDAWVQGTATLINRGVRGPYPVDMGVVAAGNYDVQGIITDTMDPSVTVIVPLGTVTVTA